MLAGEIFQIWYRTLELLYEEWLVESGVGAGSIGGGRGPMW
jgi:hypothetical protein